jgi:hypothetical protein
MEKPQTAVENFFFIDFFPLEYVDFFTKINWRKFWMIGFMPSFLYDSRNWYDQEEYFSLLYVYDQNFSAKENFDDFNKSCNDLLNILKVKMGQVGWTFRQTNTRIKMDGFNKIACVAFELDNPFNHVLEDFKIYFVADTCEVAIKKLFKISTLRIACRPLPTLFENKTVTANLVDTDEDVIIPDERSVEVVSENGESLWHINNFEWLIDKSREFNIITISSSCYHCLLETQLMAKVIDEAYKYKHKPERTRDMAISKLISIFIGTTKQSQSIYNGKIIDETFLFKNILQQHCFCNEHFSSFSSSLNLNAKLEVLSLENERLLDLLHSMGVKIRNKTLIDGSLFKIPEINQLITSVLNKYLIYERYLNYGSVSGLTEPGLTKQQRSEQDHQIGNQINNNNNNNNNNNDEKETMKDEPKLTRELAQELNKQITIICKDGKRIVKKFNFCFGSEIFTKILITNKDTIEYQKSQIILPDFTIQQLDIILAYHCGHNLFRLPFFDDVKFILHFAKMYLIDDLKWRCIACIFFESFTDAAPTNNNIMLSLYEGWDNNLSNAWNDCILNDDENKKQLREIVCNLDKEFWKDVDQLFLLYIMKKIAELPHSKSDE